MKERRSQDRGLAQEGQPLNFVFTSGTTVHVQVHCRPAVTVLFVPWEAPLLQCFFLNHQPVQHSSLGPSHLHTYSLSTAPRRA